MNLPKAVTLENSSVLKATASASATQVTQESHANLLSPAQNQTTGSPARTEAKWLELQESVAANVWLVTADRTVKLLIHVLMDLEELFAKMEERSQE